MIDFDEPRFSFPVAVRLTDVDRKTIENWMTYDHVSASGEARGRERRFSPADLLKIVLLNRLREPFNVQAATAAGIARDAVENYRLRAASDIAEIWMDGAVGATDYRVNYSLSKTGSGELVSATGFVEDTTDFDGVMIVIPVGLLARSLFKKTKILLDAATENQSA